jgi:two-component system chemotaxis response regulator CheB
VSLPAGESPLVVVAGSAGSLGPLTDLLARLPAGFAAATVVALHTRPEGRSRLAELLSRHAPLPVGSAGDGELLEPGRVHVVPPGHNAIIAVDRRLHLLGVHGARPPRPSIDLLFSTAAAAGTSVVAVVLSGAGQDGVIGAQAVNAMGGNVVIQDPRTAQSPGEP